MSDYTIIFDGVDICEEYDAILSGFEDEPPEPKTKMVDVPAGADIDITEALGPVAFHNGTHRFELALTGDESSIRDRLRLLMSHVHGKRNNYQLSWDDGYTYVGRWKVTDIERVADHLTRVTITTDRYPWKVKNETVELVTHPTTAELELTGSERYSNLTVMFRQGGTVSIDGGEAVEYEAGTHQIAGQLYGDADIVVTVDDWYYYVDGTNLVVNPDYYTMSGSNVDFTNPPFSVVGSDIACPDEAKQHVTVSYTRKDL